MRSLKAHLPGLAATAALFYLAPLAINSTLAAIFLLLLLLPAMTFLLALGSGLWKGFAWVYPLAVLLLFLPCIPLHYNTSAAFYAPAYAALALVGHFLGGQLYKLRHK